MATTFLRPGHLHDPAKILSASSESGLVAAPAIPDADNLGKLRLRTSGVPWTTLDAAIELATGGAPTGYGNNYPFGDGAKVRWRMSSESSTGLRGFADSMFLQGVRNPIAYDAAATNVRCSTPRQLPDGYLGILRGTDAAAVGGRFARISSAWAGSIVSAALQTLTSWNTRPDFVVLPSGRLIAANFGTYAQLVTSYSDDYGATWTALGNYVVNSGAGTRDVICMEVVGDDIVMVTGGSAAGVTTEVYVSRDGGMSFDITDTGGVSLVNPRTCVTKSGIILVAEFGVGDDVTVYRLVPGGAIELVGTVAIDDCYGSHGAIVTRDDGTNWIIYTEGGIANTVNLRCVVSTDDGISWARPSTGAQNIAYNQNTAGSDSWIALSLGCWRGRLVLAFTGLSPVGAATEQVIQVCEFGGWSQLGEHRRPPNTTIAAQPFEHTYIPSEYPQDIGWTRASVGARPGLATLTNNEDGLHMVADAFGNDTFTSSAAFWNPGAGDERTLKFRIMVSSGGSLSAERSGLRIEISDGAGNKQGLLMWSTTTTTRFLDLAGNTLVDVTLDNTTWTNWIVYIQHDASVGSYAKVAAFYRKDSDAEGAWTVAMANTQSPEIVGAGGSRVVIGGTISASVDWRLGFLAVADDDQNRSAVPAASLYAYTEGRPLTYAVDYYLASGVNLGGYGTGGIPGDGYAVDTTYSYGKENTWREFRPSRQWRTAADNTSANAVFDAGASDKFKGNTIAIFGTNYRTATLQLNTADSWGAPAVSLALDATVTSFTIGAGVRGPGFVGPAATANWRPGRFRSDGDAHRWFLAVGQDVYEITDNDEDRIYVGGVNFSAASGTAYIFGDRMGTTGATFYQYRYARLLIGSQDTADGHYRTGTLIFDKKFEPAQTYDHGFVDRIEPMVQIAESDTGYRSGTRLGPRRETLAIQWPGLDRLGPRSDVERRIADFYRAIEGSNRPIVAWRDTADQSTLGLYRVAGVYSATNLWGEGATAVTRIDQLVLEEEL
jgi:hypothetical protein